MGTPGDTHEMGMPWDGDTLGTSQGHPGMGHLGDGDTLAATYVMLGTHQGHNEIGTLRDVSLGGTEGHWEWHIGTLGDTLK